MWNIIIGSSICHVLNELLLPKKQRLLRDRGQNFILPMIKMKRYYYVVGESDSGFVGTIKVEARFIPEFYWMAKSLELRT